MGSPASPIVADIVMEELLRTSIERLDEKPRILTKYVDDIFAIVKTCAIENTLRQLNNFHKHIQFTMEEERDGKIPYLDTLLIRNGNRIKIDWYQKPTSSGRIINFYSCQPKNVKTNTAQNLIKRVLAISDEEFHTQNIIKIKNILRNNNFPKKSIDTLLNNNKNKRTCELRDVTKIFKSVTYVPEISERIKAAKIYNKDRYQLAFSSNNTLKQLFSNTKSKIDKMDKGNVIYKISCKGDEHNKCDQMYVGQTGNKLKTRISGHKSDYRNLNKNSAQKTALAAHCAKHTHVPDLEKVEILQREEKYNRRMTLEVLHIIKIPKEMRINYKSDTENCANSYRHLINKKIF